MGSELSQAKDSQVRRCCYLDVYCATLPAMLATAARLCCVRHGTAFFTTQQLEKQWGDDWNDAPYEHNYGDPYDWRSPHDDDKPRWEIVEIGFSADLDTPADRHGPNSPYAVQDINRGAVPWLMSPDYSKETVKLWAGTSAADFIKTIRRLGGRLWLPMPRVPEGR